MKAVMTALLGLVLAGAVTTASAQNEQFIPMNGYWVGPYAPGGSGIFGGFIDYINMLNARDGGVGGVKLTYEKCETEYNNARGVECYEREKIVGVWWSGAEEDVLPAGSAAKGYISAGFNAPGSDFPVMKDIKKFVYDKGKGEFEDKARFGSIYHTRGVVAGIVTTEAIRVAQAKFGKGKPITGEQMRWGIEHINIDDKRLKELGATGLMQALKVSCMDHEGGGAVKFLQWDGKKWNVITDWIASDQSIVRPMVEASAAQYAKEKGIAPRDCSKEK